MASAKVERPSGSRRRGRERRGASQRAASEVSFFLFSVFCCVAVFLKRFAGCRVALRNLYKYFVVIYECENVCV